jgi:hypothetical protein
MSFGTQLCVFDRHHLGNFPLPRIASVLSASCPYVKFVRGHMWSLGFLKKYSVDTLCPRCFLFLKKYRFAFAIHRL